MQQVRQSTALDSPSATPIAGAAIAVYRAWLVLGIALVLMFPALRAQDAVMGWWPLWLVVLPLAGLLGPALRAFARNERLSA